jgi:hypothetical protein
LVRGAATGSDATAGPEALDAGRGTAGAETRVARRRTRGEKVRLLPLNSSAEGRAMSEILLFQAVVFVCGTTAFVATLRLLRRYLELRHERPGAGATADALAGLLAGLDERLARLEQTAEATALEVERLAEAHR